MPSVKYADAAVPMTSKPCLVVRSPRQCSHRAVNTPARRCLPTMGSTSVECMCPDHMPCHYVCLLLRSHLVLDGLFDGHVCAALEGGAHRPAVHLARDPPQDLRRHTILSIDAKRELQAASHSMKLHDSAAWV